MLTDRLAATSALGNVIPIQERDNVVQSLILLGGVLRPTVFHMAIGRSVLDLPVAPGMSILQLWGRHAAVLAEALGNPTLNVRLLINRTAPRPLTRWEPGAVKLRIEEDPTELRGTGGILHDLASEYDENAQLLVASAAQILLKPAETLTAALRRAGADVALIAHEDGTPGNMMLIRCGSLAAIPGVGFVDMKEQALPLVARRHSVKVLCCPEPTGLSLLTFSGYLNALRRHYLSEAASADPDPFAEDWQPCFAVVEEGAIVDPSARVHNSVVLSGAVVERSAVVVRSIVCPEARVGPGQVVVDRLVAPAKGQANR